MKYINSLVFSLGLVVAIPTVVIADMAIHAKRDYWDTCSPQAQIVEGEYTVIQDVEVSGGTQCFNLTSLAQGTFGYQTSWTWTDSPTVLKSYDRVEYNIAAGIPIGSLSYLETLWKGGPTWGAGTSPVFTTLYDIATSSSADPSSSHDYEIKIWNSVFGVTPIGSEVAAQIFVGQNQYWNLYSGYSGSTQVFTFVTPTSNSGVAFEEDLTDFLSYLSDNQGFPTSQYLIGLQAGIQAFAGSNVVFSTQILTFDILIATNATSTTSSTTTASLPGQTPYGQCGGQGFAGPTVCVAGYTCFYENEFFSNCYPAIPTSTSSATNSTFSSSTHSSTTPSTSSSKSSSKSSSIHSSTTSLKSSSTHSSTTSSAHSSTTSSTHSPTSTSTHSSTHSSSQSSTSSSSSSSISSTSLPSSTTPSSTTPSSTTTTATSLPSRAYAQCGGQGYTGPTTCPPGWSCFYSNEFESQCLQGTPTSTTTTSILPTQTPYGQCGGIGYTGIITCAPGWTCNHLNDYFFQCVPF